MKFIIYKVDGVYYMTDEFNYRGYVRNERAIRKLSDFDNPKEIIEYFCKHSNMEPSDFVIADKQFWYAEVNSHIQANYGYLSSEDVFNATEDIVGRCFCYGIPTLEELPEYIAEYMDR